MQRTTLLLTLCLALGACQSATMPPVGYCTAPRSISVIVEVTDSISGAGVTDGATGAIRDLGYVDSLSLVPLTSKLEAGNRVGTFTITIDRSGYQPWVRSGVQVSLTGPCGNVIPVRIAARLQSAP